MAPPRRIELTQGHARVVIDVGADETVAEGAYRALKTRLSDDAELRLLLAEVAPLLEGVIARRRAQRAERPDDLGERMSQLAESFPSLVGRPGVRPWQPSVLLEQISDPYVGTGARAAMRFVGHVWNQTPRVDLHDFAAWDDAHRAAFARWAADPWWA